MCNSSRESSYNFEIYFLTSISSTCSGEQGPRGPPGFTGSQGPVGPMGTYFHGFNIHLGETYVNH